MKQPCCVWAGVVATFFAAASIGCGEDGPPLTAEEEAVLAEFRASQEVPTHDDLPDAASAPVPSAEPSSGAPPSASGSSARPRPTVFREHPIHDSGQLALTLLVPETWEVEGGITRPPNQYYSTPILTDIKVTAPDGRQAHFFPNLSFEFTAQAQAQGAQLFQPFGDGNMYHPLPESPGA